MPGSLSLFLHPRCFALVGIFLFISPSLAQTRAQQTVRGQVIDRDTRLPLPGAHVVVLRSQPLLGTATGADGWFVLEDVPLGRHDIEVRFLGYEPLVLAQVLVTSGKEAVLHVALHEQVIEGDEVVVVPEVRKDRSQNNLAFVSARSFTVEETRRYAGGLDDPARMASAFAGITTGGGIQENAMIIRGNAPKGVLWRLEGVDIPNPSHFANLSVAGGGGLTLFSSHLLADSDFFTGAFPAEYGNALAGVFDMAFRTGNRAQREYTVQAGLLGIDLAAEGPFMTGRPSTYLFNYRYSTLGLLLPLLPTEDVARYQDLSFKLSFPTLTRGRLDVWGIGGLDRQSMTADEDSSQWEFETWDRLDGKLALDVGAAGFSHTFLLSQRSYLRSTAAATVNRTVLDQQRIDDDLVLKNDLSIVSTDARFLLSTFVNHKFDAHHVNRTGVSIQRLLFDLDLRAAPEAGEPLVPVAEGNGSSTLIQLYSQSRLDLTTRLALSLGMYAQHFALTEHATLEPRVGLQWQFDEAQRLSLGYGLHSQIEDLRIYLARPAGAPTAQPNRKLDVTRAHHLVLGYDRRIGDSARLKLETYYQYLFDVPVIPDSTFSLLNFEQDWTLSERLINEGEGKNHGVELTLERFLKDGYYLLLTGSLFQSRYRGGDDVWRRTRFDRRFAGNALFGKEINVGTRSLIGLNGRLVFMGGKRRTPVDLAASQASKEVIFDERHPFEAKNPDLFLLDLTLIHRRNHARFSEVWALQIKNVLAAKDVSLDYNFATERVEEVREGFPLPVLSYTIAF